MYMIDLLCHDISGSSASSSKASCTKHVPVVLFKKAFICIIIMKYMYMGQCTTSSCILVMLFQIFQDKQKKSHIEMYG